MSEELKPCPFCGSSAQIVSSWSHHSNEYAIQCSGDAFEEDRNYGCPACNNEQDEQGGFGFSYISTVKEDKERVIEIWNTRSIEDQLKAENEKLKETLRETLREIANTSSKYELENYDDNSNNYWEWDDNALDLLIEIDKIVEQALNEVTK